MSSPLIFFIVIVAIDLILKSLRDKKKVGEKRERDITNTQPQVGKKRTSSTIRDLRRSVEEEFERQKDKVENLDTRNASQEDDTPQKREITAKRSREELIQNQKDKVNKHSEMEKSKRLEKERTLTKARLSDSQVPLASKHPNRKMDDVDFGTRKPVTIEVKDTSRVESGSSLHGILNIKEDILKGIIYSEILSKPKSLKK